MDELTRQKERRWSESGTLEHELDFRKNVYRQSPSNPIIALEYADCLARSNQPLDDVLETIDISKNLEPVLSGIWLTDNVKAGRFAKLLRYRNTVIKDEHYFAVWVVRNRCERLSSFEDALNAGDMPVLYSRLPRGGLETLNSIRDELVASGLTGGRPYGHASSRIGRIPQDNMETFGIYVNISDTPVGIEVDVPWGE